MPNWCYGTLTVSGDAKELKRFEELVKSDRYALDADKIIPYPEEYKKLDDASREWEKKADDYAKSLGLDRFWCGDQMSEKDRKSFYKEHGNSPKDGFNQGGYEWCLANWGTKWGFCDVTVSKNKGEYNYSFCTAWSPINPVIIKMGNSLGIDANTKFIINNIQSKSRQALLNQYTNQYIATDVIRLQKGTFLFILNYDDSDTIYLSDCIATKTSV